MLIILVTITIVNGICLYFHVRQSRYIVNEVAGELKIVSFNGEPDELYAIVQDIEQIKSKEYVVFKVLKQK